MAGKNVRRKAWRVLRATSLALERSIKEEMPVDTGRARASWGHWTAGDIKDRKKAKADRSDAVWEQDEASLTITQGTNVPYVIFLEQGHSQQREAGFIRSAAKRAGNILAQKIREIVDI